MSKLLSYIHSNLWPCHRDLFLFYVDKTSTAIGYTFIEDYKQSLRNNNPSCTFAMTFCQQRATLLLCGTKKYSQAKH